MKTSRIGGSSCGILLVPALCIACGGVGADGDARTLQGSEPLSGDLLITGVADATGAIVARTQELTVSERDSILEQDLLLADYLRTTDVFKSDDFMAFLEQEGRQDILEQYKSERSQNAPSQGSTADGLGQSREGLTGTTSAFQCAYAQALGLVLLNIYTNTNFTGTKACIWADSSIHLNLPTFAGGVFDRSIWSTITITSGINTVWGSHYHDAYIDQGSPAPHAPWQYQYDHALHASTVPL